MKPCHHTCILDMVYHMWTHTGRKCTQLNTSYGLTHDQQWEYRGTQEPAWGHWQDLNNEQDQFSNKSVMVNTLFRYK